MIFVEIFHDFGWFFATRIRFIEVDPDPADQNETDPNRSESETLQYNIQFVGKNIIWGRRRKLLGKKIKIWKYLGGEEFK